MFLSTENAGSFPTRAGGNQRRGMPRKTGVEREMDPVPPGPKRNLRKKRGPATGLPKDCPSGQVRDPLSHYSLTALAGAFVRQFAPRVSAKHVVTDPVAFEAPRFSEGSFFRKAKEAYFLVVKRVQPPTNYETTRMDLAEIAKHAMMIGAGRINADDSARSICAECALARGGRRARAGEDAIHPEPGSQPHPEAGAGRHGVHGNFPFFRKFFLKTISGLFGRNRHSLRDRKSPGPKPK